MRNHVKQRNDCHDRRRAGTLQCLLARHGAELSARKHILRDDITPPGEGRDAVESGADNFARDVGAALLDATARTVQSIEGALQRLETGAYGACLDCGSRIRAVRLRALPFAERCRDCQQQYDPVPAHTPLPA